MDNKYAKLLLLYRTQKQRWWNVPCHSISELNPTIKKITTRNFDHHVNVFFLRIEQRPTSSNHFGGIHGDGSIPQCISEHQKCLVNGWYSAHAPTARVTVRRCSTRSVCLPRHRHPGSVPWLGKNYWSPKNVW